MKRAVSVTTNCYHGFSVEDAINGISNAGFKYIELCATKGWTEHVSANMGFFDICDIRRKIEEKNLQPIAMSGHCNLMDKERIPDFINNIRLAAFFGCSYMVTSIGEAHLQNKAETSEDELIKQIHEIAEVLEEDHMKLALELHGHHGSGVIMKKLVDKIGSDRVEINYDTANAIYYGNVDMPADLDCCMDKIGFMHIKDKAGEQNEWNFPALGKGYVNFPMIFDKLDKAGNNCPLSVEIEFTKQGPKSLEEVNQAVKDSYDYLVSQGFEL